MDKDVVGSWGGGSCGQMGLELAEEGQYDPAELPGWGGGGGGGRGAHLVGFYSLASGSLTDPPPPHRRSSS